MAKKTEEEVVVEATVVEEPVVQEDRITMHDLKDWFGSEMPNNVFMYLFKDAPPEATIKEVKATIRQMALDFRSPPSLATQSYGIMTDVKKNGNLPPALVQRIDAWESRYLTWRREQRGDN